MIRHDHIRIDPAYRASLRDCGLDTVEKVLARVEGHVAAWSRTTDTLFVPGPEGTPGFYVKRHFFPSWIKRLRGTLRGTFFGKHRGHAECIELNALRGAGIPTVRPVAYGGRRIAHFLSACFLITEAVPHAQNLTTFAQEIADGRRTLSPAQRRVVIDALAGQLAEMHAAGISHGNLFWRNVLIRSAADGRPEFFFLDVQTPSFFERMRQGRPWWQYELAQTLVSALPFTRRTERLRFVRRYLGGTPLTPERKAELREIGELAGTWERHEQRRIHMNSLFEEWNRQLAAEQPSCGTPASGGCNA